ncbi:MAG TPA: periplasmic heavy metal sensor [Thermodesulfobacteriota bacterium]
MSSKAIKLALLISLLFNLSIISAAGYFYYRDVMCGPSARAEKRHAAFAKKLDLTAEQREKMRHEEQRFTSATEGARAELVAKRKALLAVLKEDRPDRAAIDAILSDMVALQGKIEAQAMEHIINEKSVLDKEQQARFMNLLEKRLERAHSREQRHQERGFAR